MNTTPHTLRLMNSLVTAEQAMNIARAMLDHAEAHRRSLTPSFATGPVADPHADWAAAGLLIDRAAQHLNESLPGGQTVRTAAALGALLIGVDMLVGAMADRGVAPLRMTVGLPPVAPPAATGEADSSYTNQDRPAP